MEGPTNVRIEEFENPDGSHRLEGRVAPQDSAPDWVIGLDVLVVDVLSGYTLPGVLEAFTPGEAAVRLDEAICEQRNVTVQFDSFFFEGETLYCRSKNDHFEAHITIGDVETSGLRKEPRFPVKLAGQMFPQQTGPVAITIVDISREGMGIELPMLVQPGQPIAVVSGRVFVFATVCHCRKLSEGLFRAGAEIQHVFEKPDDVVEEEKTDAGLFNRVFGKRLAATKAAL